MAITIDDDLFFRAAIEPTIANPRFVRRDWLAAEVEERLAAPDYRFLLLTAEPGAGKSTFIVQLAHDHPEWPVYLIRRDQRSPLADAGAHSFLLRLGYQLAARYPDLFTTEQVKLVVEQRIGAVASGGEAVAAEVKRLLASPFYQKVVQIRQEIEDNQGQASGLRVGEWVVDPRLLPLADLQFMALIDPARLLLEQRPGQRIVILVDALDELRAHPREGNLLHWLTNCPRLPPNVRFLLTSRPPDEQLHLFIGRQQPFLQTLTISETDSRVQTDLDGYARGLAGQPQVQSALAAAGMDQEAFVSQAVAKADGNLGYLDALGRAIDQAIGQEEEGVLAQLLKLEALPEHLEGLYAFFLRQIEAIVSQQRLEMEDPETGDFFFVPVWGAVYRRVLSVLAVALEPLTLAQIETLGHISAGRAQLGQAMNQLSQFLDQDGGRYRFYHATLPEFLTDADTGQKAETASFFVDAPQWHQRIANHYWRTYHDNWRQMEDNYGLNNLAAHLLAGAETDKLQALIDQDWLQARFAGAAYSYGGFLADLGLAWAAAAALNGVEPEGQQFKLAWPRLVRYGLLQASIRSVTYNIPPSLLAQLVKDGVWAADRALGLAAQESKPEVRADHYQLLLETGKLSQAQAAVAAAGLESAKLVRPDDRQPPGMADMPLPGAPAWNLGKRRLQALEAALANVLSDPQAENRYIYQQIPDEAVQAYLETLKADDLEDGHDPPQSVLSGPSFPQIRNPFRGALDPALNALDESKRPFVEFWPAATPDGLTARRREWETSLAQTMALAFTSRLADRHLEAAVTQSLRLGQEAPRVLALAALAPHVQGEPLQRVLPAVLAIDYADARNAVLGRLAPRLTGEPLSQTVATLNEIHEDEARRLSLLAALAVFLEGDTRQKVLERVIDLARAPSSNATAALARLGPFLPPEERRRTLDRARGALSESNISSLADLLPALPADERREIAVQMVTRPYEEEREGYLAPILVKLGRFLDDDTLLQWLGPVSFADSSAKEPLLNTLNSAASGPAREAARTAALLEVTLARNSADLIVDGLAALAPDLSEALASRAMVVVDEMSDRRSQTQGRIILASCLGPDEARPLLEVALAAALDMDDRPQAEVLGALGRYHPDWVASRTGQLVPVLIGLLQRAAAEGRTAAILRLDQMLPLWQALTLPETIEEVADIILDVCWEWTWP